MSYSRTVGQNLPTENPGSTTHRDSWISAWYTTLAAPAHALAEMVTGIVMRFADIAADDPDRLPELTDDLVAAYHRLTGLRS